VTILCAVLTNIKKLRILPNKAPCYAFRVIFEIKIHHFLTGILPVSSCNAMQHVLWDAWPEILNT
jgi:hypothetical protein